jgi:hypothetical protein
MSGWYRYRYPISSIFSLIIEKYIVLCKQAMEVDEGEQHTVLVCSQEDVHLPPIPLKSRQIMSGWYRYWYLGLWIRIRIGSGFNGVSGSGSGFRIRIRIQGKEKEENKEKIQTFFLKFL